MQWRWRVPIRYELPTEVAHLAYFYERLYRRLLVADDSVEALFVGPRGRAFGKTSLCSHYAAM